MTVEEELRFERERNKRIMEKLEELDKRLERVLRETGPRMEQARAELRRAGLLR